MNNDKTLTQKFIEQKDYPVWYYKELIIVGIDYVICNLLKETFVVEINDSKHEVTFGKNKNGNIYTCIKYDDIKNSNLTSHNVVEKGFREGNWFVVSEIDTSDNFKANYCDMSLKYKKEKNKKMYKEILNNAIKGNNDLNINQKDLYLNQIENSSYKELNILIKALMNNINC